METQAQNPIDRLPTSIRTLIQPPPDFTQGWLQEVSVDGTPAMHLRFERAGHTPAPALGGEHYSVVLAQDGSFKGETSMDARLAEEHAKAELPTEEAARITAMAYLEAKAPDLLETIELHWIAPHVEKVMLTSDIVAGGLAVSVTGMKVKCRNRADGSWFWVIVGSGGQIITFERDVYWHTPGSLRQTEMWLHDLWLMRAGRGFNGEPIDTTDWLMQIAS